MVNLRLIQFLILLLIFGHATFATQAITPVASLNDFKDGSLLLGPYLRIFEDKQGSARWEDVLAGKHHADFKAQNKAVPNFGSTRSVIWAVVDLDLRSGALSGRPPQPPILKERGSEDYLLELSHPVLDYVDVVVQDLAGKEILHRWETGDLRPFDSRPINHRNFLFPIKAKTMRVWLRVSSESTLQIPIRLWHNIQFQESDSGEIAFLGGYYGLLMVMILYNIIVASSLRSLSGYLYAAYMSCVGLLQMSLDGVFYQLLPSFGYLSNLGITFWGHMAYLIAPLFLRQYLQIYEWKSFRSFLLSITSVYALIGLIVALIFGYYFAVRLQAILGLIGPIFVLYVILVRVFSGYRPASYLLLGYSFLILSSIVLVLTRFGVLPSSNFVLNHPVHFGSGLEAILLSFGLADRIRLIQKEKELAQAATIEQQRILNEAFARFVPAPFLQIL